VSLTIELAVEKVLFRLALMHQGVVPIVRLFLELPLSLEEVEQQADRVADGTSVVKNEWGEFLSYEFPEIITQTPRVPEGCPTCGDDPPPAPTEGGQEQRQALLCDSCYGEIRRKSQVTEDTGRLERLKAMLFSDEEHEDPAEVARLEHEIFYLGLGLGIDQFTHTTLAAQSREPANKLRARLDKLAARRYIVVGLLPSGDTVGYKFPVGLDYPRAHYKRAVDKQAVPSTRIKGIKLDKKPAAVEEKPKPVSGLKIVIKDRRNRGG
jgi:hypothetical protein